MGRLMAHCMFLLLLLASSFGCCAGMVTSGLLPQSTRFDYYAGKFCFGASKTESAGSFTVDVSGVISANSSGRFYLFVYDDEKDHWDDKVLPNELHWQYIRSNWDTLSCEERKRWATSVIDLTQLDGGHSFSTKIVESIRPRFWYFAFSNCGADIVESVNYTIHAVNLEDGFRSEFSIDKNGAVWLHTGAALIFSALLLALVMAVRKSSPMSGGLSLRTASYKPLTCFLMVSVLLSSTGDFCLAVHYRSFGFDGVGDPMLEVFGTLLVSLAKAAVSLVLLTVAKGWNIVDQSSGKLLLCALVMIVVVTVAAELYGEFVHDASTTLYLYEGPPGKLIVVLNALLGLEAFRSLAMTYESERSSEMQAFYMSVALASFLHFLKLPVCCILSTLFAPWVRAKYVARIEVATRFMSAALLTYCLWPSHLDIMIRSRLEEARNEEEELEELEILRE